MGTSTMTAARGRAQGGPSRSRDGARRARRARRLPWVAPTAHGAWLLVVAAVLIGGGHRWGLGLVRDAGLLLVCTAAACLGAACLMAVLRALAIARRRPRLLGPTRVQAGESARWGLALGRTGRSHPAWVLWCAPGHRELRPLVEGRGDLVLTLPLRGRRRLEARTLTFTDPLGLWRARLPLAAALEVLVLPRPLTAPGPPVSGVASADRLRTDRGEELAGLRDYRRGDHLSSVHWRQSARLDRLVVVDAERRTRVRRTVALDIRAGSYGAARPARSARPGGAAREGRRPARSRGPGRLRQRDRPALEADAFETAVSLAAGVLRAWESTGADVRLVVGRRLMEADDGERGGITPLLEALALVTAAAGPQEPAPGEPRTRAPGARDTGMRQDDAPDIVITGTAALADVGQELAAPPAAGAHVRAAPPAAAPGPAPAPAAGGRPAALAGARGVRAPAARRMRTVPAGAELLEDAGAARGEER